MPVPIATIAFVPREVFSTTRRSLEALYERTREPFQLVCVDGASPPEVAEYLREAAAEKGFALLRTDRYVTPNQARNLAARWAMEHTPGRHVVFVDNDAMVSPGWLGALVRCADQTGAWVVGPAYFEHLPERHTLHMYGGQCRIDVDAAGRRRYFEKHHLSHKPINQVAEQLTRRETELIEFHTVLMRQEAIARIGLLDEGLFCHSEHGDLCLSVRQAGGTVWLEPDSQVTYVPPRRLDPADREFFLLRWSEAWLRSNKRRMQLKWDLYPSDMDSGRGKRWVGEHRRLAMASLRRMRRLIGRKWTRSIEKRLVAPLERIANRRRFPFKEYGQLPQPEVTVVHQPQSLTRAA